MTAVVDVEPKSLERRAIVAQLVGECHSGQVILLDQLVKSRSAAVL